MNPCRLVIEVDGLRREFHSTDINDLIWLFAALQKTHKEIHFLNAAGEPMKIALEVKTVLIPKGRKEDIYFLDLAAEILHENRYMEL